MILWFFQLDLKHSCEQKNEPWMPSLRQVGHCNLAPFSQPGVSQVPREDILGLRYMKHEDLFCGNSSGRRLRTVTLTALTDSRLRFRVQKPKEKVTRFKIGVTVTQLIP